MPFTGSHPAAALPLLRTPLIGSALVVGSMVPDTPMFGLSPVSYATTHSALGIVTADVALGLAFYTLWHVLIVPPALALSPRAVRARVPQPRRRFSDVSVASVRWLVLVTVSVAVGAATHVGWDEFTHDGRWGTHHIGVLTRSFHGVAGYQWAQYGSGLFGALVILGYLVHWWRHAVPRSVPSATNVAASTTCALIVVGASAVTAVVAAMPDLTAAGGGANLHASAYAAATRGVAGGAIAVLAVALGWHLAARIGRRHGRMAGL